MRETYFISNNSNGTYKSALLSNTIEISSVCIKSFYISKAVYTDNSSISSICIRSKTLANFLKVYNNTLISDVIFSCGVNGLTDENVFLPNLNLELKSSQGTSKKLIKFDDFLLCDQDGSTLDLTTSSVRFSFTLEMY